MHFLTCPFATHQKNEGRKGKQQMTRKIDKTWGLPYKKYWQDMSDFFCTPLLSLEHFSAASDSMNDVTSLWQDLMKYCWYVTCQRLLLWRKTKWLAFNHGLFWHPQGPTNTAAFGTPFPGLIWWIAKSVSVKPTLCFHFRKSWAFFFLKICFNSGFFRSLDHDCTSIAARDPNSTSFRL